MEMKRIGACTLGLRMLGLEEALDQIKEAGYAGIDIWQVSPYYDNQGHVGTDDSPARRAEAKVGRSIDDPPDPAGEKGSCAHGARLKGRVEGGSSQAPISKHGGG